MQKMATIFSTDCDYTSIFIVLLGCRVLHMCCLLHLVCCSFIYFHSPVLFNTPLTLAICRQGDKMTLGVGGGVGEWDGCSRYHLGRLQSIRQHTWVFTVLVACWANHSGVHAAPEHHNKANPTPYQCIHCTDLSSGELLCCGITIYIIYIIYLRAAANSRCSSWKAKKKCSKSKCDTHRGDSIIQRQARENYLIAALCGIRSRKLELKMCCISIHVLISKCSTI